MKNTTIILAVIASHLLTGCATTPVMLSAVGPNPFASSNGNKEGQLEVFSAKEGRIEGDNPTWFQHTDYRIYTMDHQPFKRVHNVVAYYDEAPKVITLPVGSYLIAAQSKDYFSVEVPVVIQAGRLTIVHLDDGWTPPAGTPKTQVTYAPNGAAIGWHPQ